MYMYMHICVSSHQACKIGCIYNIISIYYIHNIYIYIDLYIYNIIINLHARLLIRYRFRSRRTTGCSWTSTLASAPLAYLLFQFGKNLDRYLNLMCTVCMHVVLHSGDWCITTMHAGDLSSFGGAVCDIPSTDPKKSREGAEFEFLGFMRYVFKCDNNY